MLETQPLDGVVELDVHAQVVGDVHAQVVGIELQGVAGNEAAVLPHVQGKRGDRTVDRRLPVPIGGGMAGKFNHDGWTLPGDRSPPEFPARGHSLVGSLGGRYLAFGDRRTASRKLISRRESSSHSASRAHLRLSRNESRPVSRSSALSARHSCRR